MNTIPKHVPRSKKEASELLANFLNNSGRLPLNWIARPYNGFICVSDSTAEIHSFLEFTIHTPYTGNETNLYSYGIKLGSHRRRKWTPTNLKWTLAESCQLARERMERWGPEKPY